MPSYVDMMKPMLAQKQAEWETYLAEEKAKRVDRVKVDRVATSGPKSNGAFLEELKQGLEAAQRQTGGLASCLRRVQEASAGT